MFHTNRVLFVHQPRTGGDWLTAWALRTFPALSVTIDVHHRKHATRSQLVGQEPALASLQAFTVVRDESDRRASYLKHCRTYKDDGTATGVWLGVCKLSHVTDADTFLNAYHLPAALYADPDVTVIPYSPDLTAARAWVMNRHPEFTDPGPAT